MKRNRRKSAGLFLALCVAGAASPLSCTDFSDRVALPIDCTVGDAYEIDTDGIGDFEGTATSWYNVPDGTGTVACDHPLAGTPITEDVVVDAADGASENGGAGGASGECVSPTTIPVPTGFCQGPRYSQAVHVYAPIPGGSRCGSTQALHLEASRNNDWGGFFGNFDFAKTTTSVSQWDGIALWARAEQGSQKSVTIALEDKYTVNLELDPCTAEALRETDPGNPDLQSFCVTEELDDSQSGVTNVSSTGSGTITTGVAGWVPSEDACGNAYEYHLTVTNDWQLYIIPFEDFTQQPLPNRRIEGFDKESLRGVAIRIPKDSVLDMWIDDFGFYRAAD